MNFMKNANHSNAWAKNSNLTSQPSKYTWPHELFEQGQKIKFGQVSFTHYIFLSYWNPNVSFLCMVVMPLASHRSFAPSTRALKIVRKHAAPLSTLSPMRKHGQKIMSNHIG